MVSQGVQSGSVTHGLGSASEEGTVEKGGSSLGATLLGSRGLFPTNSVQKEMSVEVEKKSLCARSAHKPQDTDSDWNLHVPSLSGISLGGLYAFKMAASRRLAVVKDSICAREICERFRCVGKLNRVYDGCL